jgi:hypothetical protein
MWLAQICCLRIPPTHDSRSTATCCRINQWLLLVQPPLQEHVEVAAGRPFVAEGSSFMLSHFFFFGVNSEAKSNTQQHSPFPSSTVASWIFHRCFPGANDASAWYVPARGDCLITCVRGSENEALLRFLWEGLKSAQMQ